MMVMRSFCIGLVVVLSALSAESKADDSSFADLDRALTVEEAQSLKSPVPFTEESIAQGRTAYLRYACGTCHGADGRAMVDFAGPVTDLTSPGVWVNGTSEGEIFRSIRDGVSGMPAYRQEIGDEERIWHLVSFIRSLWPADAQ